MKTKRIGTPAVVAIIVIIVIVGISGYFVLKGGEGVREGDEEEEVPAPAEFEVSNLTFYPSEVEVGEPVEISATVKNVGDLEGTYTVELKIDGEIQETRDVTLARGATETVSFMVTRDTSGTYTIEVNGLQRALDVLGPLVEIINWENYYRPSDPNYSLTPNTIFIYGEIKNVSTKYVNNIKLEASFYDNRGYLLDIRPPDWGSVLIPKLVPNQKTPFKIANPFVEPEEVAQIDVAISSYTTTPIKPYREFEILNHELKRTEIGVRPWGVVGEIVNTGYQTAYGVHVGATFYDAEGKIIACDEAILGWSMLPNQVKDFEILPAHEFGYSSGSHPEKWGMESYVLHVYEGEE